MPCMASISLSLVSNHGEIGFIFMNRNALKFTLLECLAWDPYPSFVFPNHGLSMFPILGNSDCTTLPPTRTLNTLVETPNRIGLV